MVDALLMLLAIICAGPMVYGIYAGRQRQRGVEVTPLRVLLTAGWQHAAPVVEVLGYLLKRAIAHQWKPTEDEKPMLLRATLTPAYVYDEAEDEDDEGIVGGVVGSAKNSLQPIATPQNGNNDAVVIAALARLIASGDLTQTAAIKTGLGVAPSSTSVRYAEVRNALKAEVERIKGAQRGQFALTPEQIEWRKKVGLEEAA